MSRAAAMPEPEPESVTMPFEDLEHAYNGLALAIDAAGPDHDALFLTRLALVLAHRCGNLKVFEDALATALDDLASARGA
jgi:hypothetical protein